MIKIGILGGAGYTGGELFRLLINHPEAEIVFVNSESNAGNLIAEVHEGLLGETDMRFTSETPFDAVDVLFFCFGHGKSAAFLKEHAIPAHVKIIDLAQDFRLEARENDYVYGLPEINSARIARSVHVANPGCFATCIQLALLPAAKMQLIRSDVAVNAITGSTGAGQSTSATTHFSWRNNNLSIYASARSGDCAKPSAGTGISGSRHRFHSLSRRFRPRNIRYIGAAHAGRHRYDYERLQGVL